MAGAREAIRTLEISLSWEAQKRTGVGRAHLPLEQAPGDALRFTMRLWFSSSAFLGGPNTNTPLLGMGPHGCTEGGRYDLIHEI